MTDDVNDATMQRAAQVQAGLVGRHGEETTGALIGGVSTLGLSPAQIAQVVHSPTAISDFEKLGAEGLLGIMQGRPSDQATKNAEVAYGRVREAWRTDRGRR